MKRFYTLLMLLALALVLTVPVQAQEDLEMPPVLLEQLGLEPGCTVIGATQVWATETCTLDCGKMHPNKAAGWYKKQMTTESGMVDAVLDWHEGGTRAMGQKQGATLTAQANKVDGYTQVVLTIDDIEPLGGTPVDPDAPAEEPEAVVEEQAQAGIDPGAKDATGPVTEEGAGLSAEIWELVAMHDGDTILEELMTNGNPGALLSTSATSDEILGYYSDALAGTGWMQVARHVEKSGGMVTFFKGEDTFIVATDNEAASGTEYHLLLNKGQ